MDVSGVREVCEMIVTPFGHRIELMQEVSLVQRAYCGGDSCCANC